MRARRILARRPVCCGGASPSGAARRMPTCATKRRCNRKSARLEELRLTTLEERIEADLAGGDASQLVPELEALVREHPHRERLRGFLMLALYRSGRQAEALETYRRRPAASRQRTGSRAWSRAERHGARDPRP